MERSRGGRRGRPSSNTTAISFLTIELGVKRAEMLLEILPKAGKFATLAYTRNFFIDPVDEVVQFLTKRGITHVPIEITNLSDVGSRLQDAKDNGVEAVVVVSNPQFTSQRNLIVRHLNDLRLPAAFPLTEYARAGGLIAYGASIAWAYKEAGVYGAKVLAGQPIGNLPVVLPTRFDLVVNLKTSSALGLRLPDSLLARADEIVDA